MEQAAYSGTPLAKKLGISTQIRVFPVNTPSNYRDLLAPLPDGVTFATRLTPTVDVVHLFTVSRQDLARALRSARQKMRQNAAFWVSWPKRASKRPTDITEDVIREVALPLGFVDVKVCAVDEVWSGLKLVIRQENRRQLR